MAEEMITIKKSVYDQLVERDEWLGYLEGAGVDNWDGYSFAHEAREEDREKAKVKEAV